MTYPSLACNQFGTSYTVQPFSGGSTIYLAKDGGAEFPSLQDGQFFYARVIHPCRTACLQVKVLATEGDTLTVEPVSSDCMPVGSSVWFDKDSDAALSERLSGLVREASNPLVFVGGKLTLDWDTFKQEYKEILLSAEAPLSYDSQSGNLTIDADKLIADQKGTIMGWFSATSPLDYDATTGAFSIDIAALKTALGITT